MSNGTAKVIGAVIAGTVAGLVLGVLFAPDKGSKTRSRLAGSAKDLADDLKYKMREEANELRIKAEELEAQADKKLDGLASKIKMKANSILNPTAD